MRDSRSWFVRWVFALSAFTGTVACSGAGSGGVGGVASAVPAVPGSSTLQSGSAIAGTSPVPESEGIDATDIAALAVPLTSDVAPVGDAAPDIAYNWNLAGDYHGIIKQWLDGVERTGTVSFSIFNRPPSRFGGGQGTIVIGQSSTAQISTTIVTTYKHSIAVQFAMSFGPGETCFARGTARRYRHVFEGVLLSPPGGIGCSAAANSTTYFKVRPTT